MDFDPFYLHTESLNPGFDNLGQRISIGLDREKRELVDPVVDPVVDPSNYLLVLAGGFYGEYGFNDPGRHAGEGPDGDGAEVVTGHVVEE